MRELQNMSNKKHTCIRIFFNFFLVLTLYYFFVWMVLPFFADPRLHQFEGYHRLHNWDLRQHARGDFDADGKEDLIAFTGCAWFSSVDTSSIPNSERCTERDVAGLFLLHDRDRIGQRYAQEVVSIKHSYLAKEKNSSWYIFVNSNGELKKYEINSEGLLAQKNVITMFDRINEFLYALSRFFVVLALPLLPLTSVFTLLFEPMRPAGMHVYESITLLIITLILYVFSRKIERPRNTSRVGK